MARRIGRRTALAAAADVYLDDFLLFDVSKPITDTSFLEIEKSTLHGHAYQTGGGRTVNANVIDIMITWMVNNDREFLQGGAIGATQPGGNAFPYLAPPNTQLQTVVDSVDLSGLSGSGVGSYRDVRWHVASVDRQDSGDWSRASGNCAQSKLSTARRSSNASTPMDNSQRLYRYSMISGIPADGLYR